MSGSFVEVMFDEARVRASEDRLVRHNNSTLAKDPHSRC